MPRYIDAGALDNRIKAEWAKQVDETKGYYGLAHFFVETQPTADVAPVVHAHWIYRGSSHYGLNDWCHRFECSVCGREVKLDTKKDIAEIPYCHCGAKMDRRAKDEG